MSELYFLFHTFLTVFIFSCWTLEWLFNKFTSKGIIFLVFHFVVIWNSVSEFLGNVISNLTQMKEFLTSFIQVISKPIRRKWEDKEQRGGWFYHLIAINIMIACSSKLSNSEVSDSRTSLTLSTRSSKRLQRSNSKNSERSLSRESNVNTLRNFFVKSVCAEQLLRDNVVSHVVQREERKKREPTPCRSKKLIPSCQNTSPLPQDKGSDLGSKMRNGSPQG